MAVCLTGRCGSNRREEIRKWTPCCADTCWDTHNQKWSRVLISVHIHATTAFPAGLETWSPEQSAHCAVCSVMNVRCGSVSVKLLKTETWCGCYINVEVSIHSHHVMFWKTNVSNCRGILKSLFRSCVEFLYSKFCSFVSPCLSVMLIGLLRYAHVIEKHQNGILNTAGLSTAWICAAGLIMVGNFQVLTLRVTATKLINLV